MTHAAKSTSWLKDAHCIAGEKKRHGEHPANSHEMFSRFDDTCRHQRTCEHNCEFHHHGHENSCTATEIKTQMSAKDERENV